MAKVVAVNVIKVNEEESKSNLPKSVQVTVDGTVTEGLFWRVPTEDSIGVLLGYQYVRQSAKPTNDSVKVLRLHDFNSNYIYWATVGDNDDETVWTVRANADTPAAWPVVNVPQPIVETTVCADVNGKYDYFTITRALGSGQVYVPRVTGNQTALFGNGSVTNPGAVAGYTTLSAIATALNTALGNSGAEVFAVDGSIATKLNWTSTAYPSASLSVAIGTKFDSNVAPSLTGSNVWNITLVADGVTLPVVTGADMATLLANINATQAYTNLGTFGLIASSTKVELVSTSVTAASLVIGQQAP